MLPSSPLTVPDVQNSRILRTESGPGLLIVGSFRSPVGFLIPKRRDWSASNSR
jgi:hypothetical protein